MVSPVELLPVEVWVHHVLPAVVPVRPGVSDDIRLLLPAGMSTLLANAVRALFVGSVCEVRTLLALRRTCRTLRDWVDSEYHWLWAGVWIAHVGPDAEWRGARLLRELDCGQLAHFHSHARVRDECALAARALRTEGATWLTVARGAVRRACAVDYRRACEAAAAAAAATVARKRRRATAAGEHDSVVVPSPRRRRTQRRAQQHWLQAARRLVHVASVVT